MKRVCKLVILAFVMLISMRYRTPIFEAPEKVAKESIEGYLINQENFISLPDGVNLYRSFILKPLGIVGKFWIVENPELSEEFIEVEKGSIRNVKITGICKDSKIKYSIEENRNIKISNQSYNSYSLEGLADGISNVKFYAGGKELTLRVRVYHDCVGEWVVRKEAKCGIEGLEENICKDCGKVLEERAIPALGHSFVDCVCERCYAIVFKDEDDRSIMLTSRICKENGIALSGRVVIPESVTVDGRSYRVTGLGIGLFNGNTEVTEIILPDTIKYLGDSVCNQCTNLRSISMQDGVVYIGEAAFQCCYALENIEIPDTVEYIGDFAYNHCSGAENKVIQLPSKLKTIGYDMHHPAHPFYDCGLDGVFTKFSISSENEYYKVEDDILYTKDGRTLVSIPRGWGSKGCTYVMPNTVEYLGELSFSRNKNIEKVIISNSLNLNSDSEGKINYLNHGNELSVGCYRYSGVLGYSVKDNNEKYISENGILYSKDEKSVMAIPTGYDQDIRIREGTVCWEKDALWESCDKYYKIILPSTLAEIDDAQLSLLNRLVQEYGTKIVVSKGNTCFKVNSNGFLEKC